MRASTVQNTLPSTQRLSAEISPAAQQVQKALIAKGLETPMIHNLLTKPQKIDSILSSVTNIMYALGLDLNDDSLRDTPQHITKMYVNEIFAGLDYATFPKITSIDNKMGSDEMVKVANIELVNTTLSPLMVRQV